VRDPPLTSFTRFTYIIHINDIQKTDCYHIIFGEYRSYTVIFFASYQLGRNGNLVMHIVFPSQRDSSSAWRRVFFPRSPPCESSAAYCAWLFSARVCESRLAALRPFFLWRSGRLAAWLRPSTEREILTCLYSQGLGYAPPPALLAAHKKKYAAATACACVSHRPMDLGNAELTGSC
jgi:hypothetical protein